MRIPSATYRLQFNPTFGFTKAKEIVQYLFDLGISDVYASPIFKAKKGSLHGYDVVDTNQLNPELGSAEDFEELIRASKARGMGWIQDIVPNHMAFDGENSMLMDVLENGQSSEYFDFFDIEWNHPYESIQGRLLAPFLGRLYGESLEEEEIKLQYDRDGFSVRYYELKLPLRPESYASVITHRLNTLREKLGEDHPDFIKLLGILYSIKNMPVSREDVSERYHQIRFIKRMLWELYRENPDIKRFTDENIEIFNGTKGVAESFNRLDSLLSEQFFRLSFWKVATEEINYRRFFNINDLISLRMEDENVLEQTHGLIIGLAKDGKFTGLRVDHIDGLYDPNGYLGRLRERAGEVYLVVEKILDLEEELPATWPVQGTTGYDFMNYVNGIFCKTRNARAFSKIYTEFTRFKTSYEDLVCDKKRLIIGKEMAGDVDNLAHLMKRISGRYRHSSDITLYGLKRALVDVLALFPVYRTYISKEAFSKTDQLYITEAVKKAKQRNPGLLYELDFIEKFLLLEFEEYLKEEEKEEWFHFVMKFQQFTGPLMAKGFEDTIFYIYNRLLSLNEVGGSPDKFGIAMKEFHGFNQKRAHFWPHSMNATSTHDTKRGEDVRARINILSEVPKEWENSIKKWSRSNKRKKKLVNGTSVPDRNDEYFLYQTLIGAFPFDETERPSFIERVRDYMVKAVREAKVHTAWLKPDTEYEEAFVSFIEEILTPSEDNEFLKEFLPFQKRVASYGIFNSVSQALIKITSPGLPDFYQGTELWDLNLVDPDNRRPVDFEKRRKILQEIRDKANKDILALINELFLTKEDGRIKLFLINRALAARRENSEVFQKGVYAPLEVGGRFKDHIVAYMRKMDTPQIQMYTAHKHAPRNKAKSSSEGLQAITVVPRVVTSLVSEDRYPVGREVWDDTHIILPGYGPSVWRNVITSEVIKSEGTLLIGDVLRHFPGALLLSEEKT